MASPSKRLPADLAAARTRIDKWRSDSRARRPIPKELWEMAVDLVPTHGVYVVSQALRLRYDKVKVRAKARQVEKRAGRSKPEKRAKPPPTAATQARNAASPAFVQLHSPPLTTHSSCGCTVELSDNSGRQMTIRSPAGMDAAVLVAAFYGVAT